MNRHLDDQPGKPPWSSPTDFRPNFIVIGAMRSGTTTLYYELRDHPEVHMAAIKETNFFVSEGGQIDLPLTQDSAQKYVANSVTDLQEYSRLFEASSAEKAVGEVSPSYLYSPRAASRIRTLVPSVRLVALLRDPVDRAYSAYLRRSGADKDPNAFLTLAESEQRDCERGTPLPHYPLILGSLYSRHLARYVELFPRSQLWIRLFEDFWSYPTESFADLHDFLGIERRPPGDDSRFNRSGVPRSERLDRLIRGGTRGKAFAKLHLPPGVVRSLANLKQKVEDWGLQPPEGLPPDIRRRLIENYFGQDIERLEHMIGQDLTAWRRV